jgi:hypothetical protein
MDEPVPLTEDEVTALAGRRARAASIVRRMTAHRPAAATGRLVTENESPARITAKEMAAVRRARRSTSVVRKRLAESAVSAEQQTEPKDRKSRPERPPKSR